VIFFHLYNLKLSTILNLIFIFIFIKTRSLYGEKFDDIIQDELQKLISYFEIGRKYNDTKQIMKDKLYQHLTNVQM